MVLRNESGDVSLKSEGQARTANWPNESRIPGFGIQNFSSEEFDEVEQSTSLKAPPHPSLKTNGSSQHTTAARSYFFLYINYCIMFFVLVLFDVVCVSASVSNL